MALEDTLGSIDSTLKAILVALISGNSAVAQLGEPEKKTRTTKAKETVAPEAVAGGVTYYISKDGTGFYTVEAGGTAPVGSNAVSEALWISAKEEFEKKSSAAAAQKSTAATGPSATVQPGTASGDVTFKQVVDALTSLSKDTAEGRGRAGVVAILNKFLADLPELERKVPKLEALGKNGEILEAVVNALSDFPADEFDPFA